MTYHPKSDFITVMQERGFLADCTDYQGLDEALSACRQVFDHNGDAEVEPVIINDIDIRALPDLNTAAVREAKIVSPVRS